MGIDDSVGTEDSEGAIDGRLVNVGANEGSSEGRIESDGLKLGLLVRVGFSDGY